MFLQKYKNTKLEKMSSLYNNNDKRKKHSVSYEKGQNHGDKRKYIDVVVLRKPRSNKLLDVIHAPKNTIFRTSRELGFELFVVKKMYTINSVSKKDQTKFKKEEMNEQLPP